MKKLAKSILTISILSAAMSAPVISQETVNQDMHQGMAMSHENMEKLHENMVVMKQQILSAKQESDPKKQQQIMDDHRKSMIKMMLIIHRNMADKPLDQQIKMAEHHLKMVEGMMPEMGLNKAGYKKLI